MFPTSTQSQFVQVFESEFQNILDVHIPQTSSADKYVQTNEKISTKSRLVGARRLATEINKLVNMLAEGSGEVDTF